MTASDAENSALGHCQMHLALKTHPRIWPYEPAPRHAPYRGPLFRVADAIEAIHRLEAAGVAHTAALDRAKRKFNGSHPGDHTYAEHALDQYVEFHEAREAEIGPMVHLGNWHLVPQGRAELGVWGPVYETSEGTREVRRFRLGRAKTKDTEWADIAAVVAREVPGNRLASRVHVVEIGLLDGLEREVVSDEDAAAIDSRFAGRGRNAANSAATGKTRTPGRDCANCKIYATCDALIPTPGALQQDQQAAWTRSVSASDLDRYENCPAQWHMLDEHLPSDAEGSDARTRGIAVHTWLKEAHKRNTPCRPSDLRDPDDRDLGLAEGLIERADYRAAYRYLRNHVESCPLADPDTKVISVEETQYCLDKSSDIIVAIKPDLILLQDSTLVLHEVKTTQNDQLPPDADSARDRYLAVALNLTVMESGLVERFSAERGEVHLEIITPAESRTYRYELSDKILGMIARERVRAATTRWANDVTWKTSPGPHCAWCPVRRWCPERDTHTAATSGNLGLIQEDATPPPF
ncbi:PD-(D/E)XK nuclease family protein [Amycolatopsis sp. RTGN1]|uniref:PD-(D/E)XK nuclease family protein n=1 Tax=Amycolatopsis ponsaeliensis TaxID=2992142 RepID=UPI00254D9DA1|nr:PD-(D/E)XK nuclease family protein [Amycolatopsis sp. RTGN1]